jgi:hypothetical protein
MILGQSRHADYTRPAGASPNFQPKLPHTGFYSHFHPLATVTHAMSAAKGFYRPPLPGPMGPAPLPAVPAAAPVAPVAPPVPAAGGTAGFGGSGFGSTGGTRSHFHVDPYMVMRQGVIPGVSPSGSNIRYGVTHAGDRVQRSMPFQTAALPPLPPPPMPMPAATHGFGLPRRRRGWFSRLIQPETVHEQAACETVGPRSDGLYVTICNGRVVETRDAAGNVHRTGADDGFMGADELGVPRFIKRHGAWAFGPGPGIAQEAWNRRPRHHHRMY